MKINYQLEMEKIIEHIKGTVPTLLLHSCCAPCSTTVIETLSEFFQITVFYFNPNIEPIEEYQKRATEQKQLLKEFPTKYPISFMEGVYEPLVYHEKIVGMEQEKEGGIRCFHCYQYRLEETAKQAEKLKFSYFGTTLTVSPYKNSQKLNEIGASLEEKYHVSYLYSDFKKKNGYKRSIELSKQYQLYRQDYCGCIYSKQDSILDSPNLTNE